MPKFRIELNTTFTHRSSFVREFGDRDEAEEWVRDLEQSIRDGADGPPGLNYSDCPDVSDCECEGIDEVKDDAA